MINIEYFLDLVIQPQNKNKEIVRATKMIGSVQMEGGKNQITIPDRIRQENDMIRARNGFLFLRIWIPISILF